MWLVLRNRQNHQYVSDTDTLSRQLLRPGDIIDLGDWVGGPGAKVEADSTMMTIEIRDRTTNQFRIGIRTLLTEKHGVVTDEIFSQFFEGTDSDRRGWYVHLPDMLAALTANQRNWLRDHNNNISFTWAQFRDAFKTGIRRRPGSPPLA
jgi:hypothetical protein